MATLTTVILGARAKGSVGPAAEDEVKPKAVQALGDRRFLARSAQSLIGGCGDERLDVTGGRLLVPTAFGGWFSAVLADALTTRTWYRPGMTAAQHALAMAADAQAKMPGAYVCIHTDDQALKTAAKECGCAAIAKARPVLELMVNYSDMITPSYRNSIVSSARELLGTNYLQPGTAKLISALEKKGVHKEVLSGGHDGLAAVINRLPGYIYDRPAFYTWCRENGMSLPFFEYDQWSMQETARIMMPRDVQGAQRFFAAADAFNRVVPYAICTPRTPLIVVG